MSNFGRFSLTVLFALVFVPSHAALIKSDYQTVGDGLLITDTSQNVDWINLTLTDGLTYAAAASTYSDFRLATQTEVENMFFSIFPTLTSAFSTGQPNNFGYQSDDAGILAQANQFADLFGFTSGLGRTRANYISDSGEYLSVHSILVNSGADRRLFLNYQGACTSGNAADCTWNGHHEFGVFMVRDNAGSDDNGSGVPVPSTLLLMALVLCGLSRHRLAR